MQRQAAPYMEMKAELSGKLMNETKLGMHMYKYGYRCVMKQSEAFPSLDSRKDGHAEPSLLDCCAKALTKSCKMPDIMVQSRIPWKILTF